MRCVIKECKNNAEIMGVCQKHAIVFQEWLNVSGYELFEYAQTRKELKE